MSSAAMLAFYVAGFLFAQVCGVMSDVPSKAVTPVAFVIRGNDQQFKFFKGRTLEEMVANGRQELNARHYDAWAFSYEGYAIIHGRQKPALFVESWSASPEKRVTIIQFLLKSNSGSVSLVGSELQLSEPVAPTAGNSIQVEPVELSAEQQLAFNKGVSRQREMKEKGYIGER